MKDQYKEICDRSLSSADACFGVKTHEQSAFMGYHAYESLGGAYCSSRHIHVPSSHTRKLNAFLAALRGRPEAHTVAQMNMQLSSLRNMLLYPSINSRGAMQSPKEVITEAQARTLVKRVRGLRNKLDPHI